MSGKVNQTPLRVHNFEKISKITRMFQPLVISLGTVDRLYLLLRRWVHEDDMSYV